MNERIEELIVAYLHRGSTPEQERELFEACRVNPEVSNLLREHLILSLKLRQLRDRTVVPVELQNDVIASINALPSLADNETVRSQDYGYAPQFRFGWKHLAWSTLAGAAVVAVIMLFAGSLMPGPERQLVTQTQTIHDTLHVAQIDTLVRTRVVRTPVYIAQPDNGNQDGHELTQSPVQKPGFNPVTASPRSIETATRDEEQQGDTGLKPDDQPALAQGNPKDSQPSYLQQYSEMVVTLEKVRLTSDDRIRN